MERLDPSPHALDIHLFLTQNLVQVLGFDFGFPHCLGCQRAALGSVQHLMREFMPYSDAENCSLIWVG